MFISIFLLFFASRAVLINYPIPYSNDDMDIMNLCHGVRVIDKHYIYTINLFKKDDDMINNIVFHKFKEEGDQLILEGRSMYVYSYWNPFDIFTYHTDKNDTYLMF